MQWFFNKKDPKLKVGDYARISKYKTFLLKDTLKIGQKKFLLLAKLKIQFRGLILLVTWMVKQLLEDFIKKNFKKLVKKNLEQRKCLKEKEINCTSNGKGMIIHLIVRLMKKILNKIIFKWNSLITNESVFPKPFRSFGGNINTKVDLSSYATKTDLQNVTHVDTSSFALTANLANLKTKVDKLNIDKLAPIPVDFSKQSDVVKNDVVKKTVHDKLVSKVNNIDTTDFVLKTKYQTDKTELEKKFVMWLALLRKQKSLN